MMSEAQIELVLSFLKERHEFTDEEVLTRCALRGLHPDPSMLLIQHKAPFQGLGIIRQDNAPTIYVPQRRNYIPVPNRLPFFVETRDMAEAVNAWLACYPTRLELSYGLPMPEELTG